MSKGMFLFQSQGLGERSYEAFGATLQMGGVTHLYVKALDGSAWESTWDRGFGMVGGLGDLDIWREKMAPFGVTIIPWGNPRSPGLNENISELAAKCAWIAKEFGAYEHDCEPGPQYWHAIDSGDYSGVQPFFEACANLAPDADWSLDFPGSWAWTNSQGHELIQPLLRAAAPYVRRVQIQSYWNAAKAQADEAKTRACVGMAPEVEHIASTAGDFGGILDWLGAQQRKRVSVWDAVHMNGPLYTKLSAFDGNEAPPSVTRWQQPGFAALAASHPEMGEPITDPYSDNLGNVFQESHGGAAVWLKAYNRNFWLPKQGAA